MRIGHVFIYILITILVRIKCIQKLGGDLIQKRRNQVNKEKLTKHLNSIGSNAMISAENTIRSISTNESTDEHFDREIDELETSVLMVINEPISKDSIVRPLLQEWLLSKLTEFISYVTSKINTTYWLSVCKVGLFFFLWYFFTVVYNISNKRFLNHVQSPLTVAAIQLILGIPLFIPLWFVKPVKYPIEDFSSHVKIAAMHGLGNWASVVSFGSGSVSFAHIVKALEPVVAAALSVWITGTSFPLPVYLAIIPIVVGVAVASANEVSFTWMAFAGAMLSNFFYQMRMVLAKEELGDKNKISPANLFRVITIIASVQLIIIAFLIEGFSFITKWNDAIRRGVAFSSLLSNLLISGVSYYMYNEVAFWLLELIHPVTHAVGNTIKRVVIILASVIILKSPVSTIGMIGAFVAVAGTLLYSLAQQRMKINRS